MIKQSPVPFVKWAGGKRWLVPTVAKYFSNFRGTYFEPFVGGGAVFFGLSPVCAILSDTNDDLIAAYCAVRDCPEQVIVELSSMRVSKDEFARIRESRPLDPIERVMRFLYLNRTAFNGLYRVNRQGTFNVPYGCKPGTKLVNPDNIRRCSELLQSTDILVADFRVTLAQVKPGDFVYADPPYTVSHNDNGFRRYNESIFSWEDQKALAFRCHELVATGAAVAISNACHHDVMKLYDDTMFESVLLTRSSRMAARNYARSEYDEVLFVSRNLTATSANPEPASNALSFVREQSILDQFLGK